MTSLRANEVFGKRSALTVVPDTERPLGSKGISVKTARITRASVILTTCLVCVAGVSATGANAARRPGPTTTTTRPAPTTTTAPAPVPTSVPLPTSVTVTTSLGGQAAYDFTTGWAVQVAGATQLGDAELLTGPSNGPTKVGFVGDYGTVDFLSSGLVPETNYTFRFRNKIWIPSTNSFIFSPWVTFSFRSPAAQFFWLPITR